MSLKHFINKVKEEHKKHKEKQFVQNTAQIRPVTESNTDFFNVNEASKKGVDLVNDLFTREIEKVIESVSTKSREYTVKKGDTLPKIAGEFFSDPAKWVMIHRNNFHKLPNPEHIHEGLILTIPEEGEIENSYPEKSIDGNYIIQISDSLPEIAERIFGKKEFYPKLSAWGFFQNKKDFYPGKEIINLKYQDFEAQLSFLAKKYDLADIDFDNLLNSQKNILLSVVAIISRQVGVPAVVAMAVSDPDNHWMNIQYGQKEIRLSENWKPMLINESLYQDLFPLVAMNIEENIFYGIELLKNLRKETNNWPKAIVNYNLSSPPGKGKPEEQKIKAQKGIYFLSGIINRLEKEENREILLAKLTKNDEQDLNFGILYKELKDYKDLLAGKYLK